MVDFLKSMLEGFDPMALVPDLLAIMDKLDVALRVVVLAGPLCLLGLGLLYLLAPPSEANHLFGYRHFWGMASVEAWQFTQKTAGMVWGGLGLVLTVVMAFICNGYRDLAWEDMMMSAFKGVVVELVLVVLSTFLINALVIFRYDRKGSRRANRTLKPKAK